MIRTATMPGAERRELLEGVREVAREIVRRYDRRYFLDEALAGRRAEELYREMAAKDLLAVGVAEELGGAGGGISAGVTIMEEMASAGVPPMTYSMLAFARESLLRHGSPEQIARHLGPLLRGEEKICFGVTEPTSGTNAFAMRTTARRTDAGTYVINGEKVFISGADQSDWVLLVARDQDRPKNGAGRAGLTLFMVDLDRVGVERRQLDIRWYAPEGQYSIYLSDVEVDADSVVGEPGRGFDHLLDSLNTERLIWAAGMLGIGEYAITRAVAYVTERAPFGAPIGSYQAVQHPLALAKIHLEAARHMTYAAAVDYEEGRPVGNTATMAKYLASRAALEAVDAAIQSHGGHAFVMETDIVTLWPLVRVMQIAPLNNESVLNHVAQHVLGLPRSY
jgi:alkylation response protein AidB-like acyl-CoA dehydrogenase